MTIRSLDIQIDFTNEDTATSNLRVVLEDRLKETIFLHDARVQMLARTLTADELRILDLLARLQPNRGQELTMEGLGHLSMPDARGVSGLLQKGCVRAMAVNAETEGIFYALTPFGFTLAKSVDSLLKWAAPEKRANEANLSGDVP